MERILPSDFLDHPYDSIFGASEHETIATNIMQILKRTGNTWRVLSEEEYIQECKKDRKYIPDIEIKIFRDVVVHCSTAEAAEEFSPDWRTEIK